VGEKIVVGPINKGLRNDVTPFNIDNDSFPVLINAYQWRGRLKRKRGTTLLNRLQRRLGVTDGAGNLVVTISPVTIGTGLITVTIGSDIFVDPGTTADPATQTLKTNSAGSATLNRVTGVLTITGSQIATAVFYNPTLPVMGLEDLILAINQFPGTLAFDTKYSYNILTNSPYTTYDVSYYKNPQTGTPVTYTQKTTWTPTWWNGQDYQQFYTVNYQGALWATNGINQPFSTTNIGMQFKPIVTVTVSTPTTASLQITGHGLVVGDFVFINEVTTTTGINFQTGYVTTYTDANNVIVTFPNATLTTNGTGGIAQYLTSRADATLDGIRWFDGDPVDVNGTFSTGKGWVNFAPPLSQNNFSIADLPLAKYYLVGARMIVPFKDRLLFIGPVVQTSTAGSAKYLQDTVIYSLNGTPYYTASYTNSPSATVDTPTSITNVYNPILVPTNQTSYPPGYFEDQTGFGGFITAGVDQPINTVESNGDVLIMGFRVQQTKFVYSGNDIVPFNFFLINSELGSSSTFSSINMGSAVLSRGSRGFVNTDQTNCTRFDLSIPSEVFEVSLSDNGAERITAQRDFINEWVYFTYPTNNSPDDTIYKFPNRTLQYNYRDDSWAVFAECYTTYGIFRKVTGNTWATLPSALTWGTWDEPWNSGSSVLLQPNIIAGNHQGFILIRDQGTGEGNSLAIQNISGSTVTSPDHTLNVGDYIVISSVSGTVSSQVNGKVFSVNSVTQNAFVLNPPLTGSPTYLGGGLIKKMYVPYIQSKQFPVAWGMGRKTRLGPQQYLLSTTSTAQIALLIFLSQNADEPYNGLGFPYVSGIVPNVSDNNGLIYSTVLYTCPESTNLGLTASNTNLQMPGAQSQSQIWHRVNTSLIGDTVQVGFSMTDTQMRDTTLTNQFAEIEIHGMILDVNQSQMLS